MPSAHGTPAAEWTIDEELVRKLLRVQHPDLAGHEVRAVDAGFDNAIYRLGDEYAVRLPRRSVAVPLIEHELRWLPELAPRLPYAVPVPVRVGRPSEPFPYPWSVVPWLPGEAADLARPWESQSIRLSDFLRALHRPAPPDAPRNPFRDVSLVEKEEITFDRLERIADHPAVTPVVHDVLRRGLAASANESRTWIHGDLHARNVLVQESRITAIIDWGDLTAGDPALDLAAFWMLFDDPFARNDALECYGASPADVARARGWAIVLGAALIETGRIDHPRHLAMGETALRRVTADNA